MAGAASASLPSTPAAGAASTVTLPYPRTAAGKPPHLLFLVFDDLGWNDVSFHGSPQVPTPNIDALAHAGRILGNHRVQPVCSPTRSSLWSGRHSIHTGIYMPFDAEGSLHLNLSYTLLPTYLSRCCGYSTSLVGKWHVGANTKGALPTSRGFDSHTGYWLGAEDYESHTVDGGYDFSRNLTVARDLNGTWSAEVFASSAVEYIATFGPGGWREGQPMFLGLTFQNVHWPLEAPQKYIDRFANATGGDPTRQLVCSMIAVLDDAVGNGTAALKDAGIWDDTLIIATSDNGGPTHGDEGTSSNNFPLRGGKNTIWEGGTRVSAFVAGAGVQNAGTTTFAPVHVTDWLPTLVTMASGQNWTNYIAPDEPPYLLGDGMDVWDTIATGATVRDWVLLETHPPGANNRVHGDALIVGDMKLIRWNSTMPQDENGWFPPPGQDPSKIIYKGLPTPCGAPPKTVDPHECNSNFCLFNITADPCEYTDLSKQMPGVVSQLQARLATFSATAVPPIQPDGCAMTKLYFSDGSFAWQPCDM